MDRMRLARTIARELRETERSNLVAVGVYGSVARGKDREFSDLDLFIILRKKRSWIRPGFREGTLVTPSVHTPAEAREEVTGSGPWLCEKLGGWRSMKPLYDPRRVLANLIAKARRPAPSQFRRSAREDLIATYEDYGKVLNAAEAGDADDAREMSLWFTGGAGGALLDIGGRAIRTDHQMTAEVRRCGALGRDMLRLRYTTWSPKETGRLARRIWKGLVQRAIDRGVRLPPEIKRSARGGPSRDPRGPLRGRGGG